MNWEGKFNDDNCDLGRKFDAIHCQFLHYRAKNREGYDPCLFCPMIIEFLKKERGVYKVEKNPKKKKSKIADCEHCKRNQIIVGRGLCGRCYGTPFIKEKYPPKAPPVGKKAKQNTEKTKDLRNNAANGLAKCDSCGLINEMKHLVLAGERLVCNDCIDAANPKKPPEEKFPCARCNKTATKKQMDKTFLCPDCQNERLSPPIELPPPQITVKHKHVSIPGVGESGPEPIKESFSLQPLTDLLADRRQDLKELRRQADKQNQILNMKLFQVETMENLCKDLETIMEKMKQ